MSNNRSNSPQSEKPLKSSSVSRLGSGTDSCLTESPVTVFTKQQLSPSKSVESQGSGAVQESEATKKAKKALTMSTAARINAKAVAYLHTLNGDPSPRSLWHRAESEDDETASLAYAALVC